MRNAPWVTAKQKVFSLNDDQHSMKLQINSQISVFLWFTLYFCLVLCFKFQRFTVFHTFPVVEETSPCIKNTSTSNENHTSSLAVFVLGILFFLLFFSSPSFYSVLVCTTTTRRGGTRVGLTDLWNSQLFKSSLNERGRGLGAGRLWIGGKRETFAGLTPNFERKLLEEP